jgi:hypothetical protein
MATRRQRERKARQRRWESTRSCNRVRGCWTVGERVTGSRANLSLRDEIRVWVSPDEPAFLVTVCGLGGYRVSLVELSVP